MESCDKGKELQNTEINSFRAMRTIAQVELNNYASIKYNRIN